MSNPAVTRRVEEIDEAGCRALLANEHVGRIAYVPDGTPMIAPVDFMVFEGMIVFRSDPSDKLSHIPLRPVCFEADGSEALDSEMSGAEAVWSVIVRGQARDVTTALNDQFEQLRRLRFPSFASFADPHWLMIVIDHISGRRLTRQSSSQ